MITHRSTALLLATAWLFAAGPGIAQSRPDRAIIIIPAGVVRGWIDIPDHLDYLSFRPSTGILQAGWVNPALPK